MTRQAFEAGWTKYCTGAGPELFPEMYWSLPLDGDLEGWQDLAPSAWSFTESSIPAKKPVNTDPYNIYYEIHPMGMPRPADLYWDPRTGRYVIAKRKNTTPPAQDELQRRLAHLDDLLAKEVINQGEHDHRKAELVKEFT
jgi:hypothetical protein